jgi:tight adherence protein B
MLLGVVVFAGVFAVVALLLVASGMGASEQLKRTLGRLEALSVTDRPSKDEQFDLRKKELLSAIPLLNRILLQLELVPRLRLLLYQANVKWTPGGFVLISLVAWAVPAYLLYLKTDEFFFSVLLGLIAGAAPLTYAYWRRSKRFENFEELLPSALDLMVSGLRGGQGLVSTLSLVGREIPSPVGPEYRIVFDEQNYGLELRTALENLCIRVPIHDNRIVMTAILIQKETGGNLAEVLERCAGLIRERFRLRREIRSKTAQGRLSGIVLALMPLLLAAGMYIFQPDIISLLWTRPAGLKMLYAGLIMITLGGLVIRRIVNIRV